MFIYIILFTILAILMAAYCYFFFRTDRILTFIIKLLMCAVFISISFISLFKNIEHFDYTQNLILIGVIMCALGDFVIGLRRFYVNKKVLFMGLGMLLFFIAHILYSSSLLIRYNGSMLIAIGIIILIYGTFLFLLIKSKMNLGKLKYPTYVYSFSAAVMLTVGAISAIKTLNYGTVTMLIGIICFVISDVFLCYTYFKDELKYMKLIKCISVVTYFTGQALIGFSLIRY